MIDQINNIALSWWGWMSAMLWQVGLLIILIACIDTVIKKWAWPQLRYALWLLVLLKLVVPPTISVPGSLTGRLQPIADRIVSSAINEPAAIVENPSTFVVSEPAVTISTTVNLSETTIESQSPNTVSENYVAAAPVLETAPTVRLVWQGYAMALWLLGMSILGVWLFARLHRLRACQTHDDPAYSMPCSFHDMMSRCAAQLRLRHIPRVVVTDELICPAVFGIFRPVLLMPKGYLSKLSRKDAEHMLLHELAHIKRGDTVVHGLYLLLQIAYWFNPLLWLARRQLHHLRELCCDATVARLLKNKTCEYRETLIDVARRFLARPVEPSLGLLGLFEDTNRLLVRLNWLEKQTWRYHKMKNLIVITITALMLAFVLPMAKAQNKPHPEGHISTEHTEKDMNKWAKEMEAWHEQVRQWQHHVEQYALEHAKLKRISDDGKPAPPPMPEMPAMPAGAVVSVDDSDIAISPPFVPGIDRVPVVESPAATPPTVPEPRRKSLQGVEVKKEDDKYVATIETNYFANVAPDTPFVVRNNIGNIILVPGKDDNCAVNAVIQARAETADEARKLAEEVTIESNSSKERYFLRPVKSGDDNWNGLSVNLNITVPLGVLPDIKTNLGNIVMTDLEGKIKAVTNLGKVKAINTTGNIELHSDLGDIEFVASKNLSAKIQASTNMGSIKSDLPLNIDKTDMFKREAAVTIGEGRNDIKLSTNMGTIHISTKSESTGEAITQVESVPGRNTGSQFLSSTELLENIRSVNAINEKKQGNRHVIERDEKMAMPLSLGSVLDITNEDGSITIIGSDTGECQVDSEFTIKAPTEEAAKKLSKEVSLEMTPTSKGLSVKIDHPKNIPSNHSYSVNLLIKAPRNTNVTLHNEDGNIKIQDLNGQIKVYNEDGNIQCENVSADVELKHEDGNINIIKSRLTDCQIIKEDGNIDIIKSVLTNCQIRKEDGNIKCEGVSGNIDFKLEDGNVTISYAEDASEKSTVSVRGEDGNVEINGGIFAECKVNRESGVINCNKVCGNLDLTLEDGNIAVDYVNNVPEDCVINAKTEEGSIRLSAPGEMFPSDARVTKKGEGAQWITKADGRNVNLKADEGSIKVDKR